MVTKQEFLQKIRSKYPSYQSVDDDTLFTKITEKYPSYKNQITDNTGILGQTKGFISGVGKDTVQGIKDIPAGVKGIYERGKERYGKAVDVGMRDIDKQGPISGAISSGISGGLATTGTMFDTAFTAGLNLLEIIAPEKVEDAVKGGIEKLAPTLQSIQGQIKDFSDSSPEAKQLVDKASLVLEGGVYPSVGAAGTQGLKKGATQGLKTAKQGIKTGLKTTGETISQQKAKILNNLKGVKTKANKATEGIKTPDVIADAKGKLKEVETGLTPSQAKGLQSNPYQADEFMKLTQRMDSPEGIDDIKNYKVERVSDITEELTNKIDEIRASKGETSQAYRSIRENPTPFNADDLITKFEETIKSKGLDIKDGEIVRVPGIKAGELNQSDVTKINQLYTDMLADIAKQDGNLTSSQFLDLRKTASDLAKYDASSTTTGQSIMRAIRKDIDSVAKEKISGLKELDAQFVDKLDEFENAIKDLVYKGGDVKGEWRSNLVSIISNLDKANRARLLKRLEEVMPGIGERIEAINNLPSIHKGLTENALPDKMTSTGGAVVGATALGSAIPGLGHVVGAVLGYTGGRIAEQLFSKYRLNAIKKILSNVSEEGQKRLKEINDKIAKNEKLSKKDTEFIDTLKVKLENETKSNIKVPNNATNGNGSVSGKINEKVSKDLANSNSNTNRNDTMNMGDSISSNTNNVSPKSVKKIKTPKNTTKAINNKGGYIDPTEMAKSITSGLKKLNKDNVLFVAKEISDKLGVQTTKVQKVLKEYVKKYGTELKNKAGDLVDDLADKLGVRSKLMDDGMGKSLDDFGIKPVNKLNTGEDITLVRGTGGGGTGGGAGEAIRGKGLYLTDNIDVANHYGKNIEEFKIKNTDLLDGEDILKNSKQIIQELPENMKRALDDDFEYSYNSLIRTIEGNTGIEAESIAEAINKTLRNKYKGVKFNIGLVNDTLEDAGLGDKSAFLLFKKGDNQANKSVNKKSKPLKKSN